MWIVHRKQGADSIAAALTQRIVSMQLLLGIHIQHISCILLIIPVTPMQYTFLCHAFIWKKIYAAHAMEAIARNIYIYCYYLSLFSVTATILQFTCLG